MLPLSTLEIIGSIDQLAALPAGKVLINTVNAHSFNVAQTDDLFAEALSSNALIPDGMPIVWACKLLRAKSRPSRRIAGWDLFQFEMERLHRSSSPDHKSKVMFMGSSENVLALIRERAAVDYPNLEIITYSPPYKPEFSDADNRVIIEAINAADPDLLWIGMTAPKQEKWTYAHWDELDIHCHVGTIGAVFDFYAGTVKRAPEWMQRHGLEWFHRLCSNPKRMWRRYIIGNFKFVVNVMRDFITNQP